MSVFCILCTNTMPWLSNCHIIFKWCSMNDWLNEWMNAAPTPNPPSYSSSPYPLFVWPPGPWHASLILALSLSCSLPLGSRAFSGGGPLPAPPTLMSFTLQVRVALCDPHIMTCCVSLFSISRLTGVCRCHGRGVLNPNPDSVIL